MHVHIPTLGTLNFGELLLYALDVTFDDIACTFSLAGAAWDVTGIVGGFSWFNVLTQPVFQVFESSIKNVPKRKL